VFPNVCVRPSALQRNCLLRVEVGLQHPCCSVFVTRRTVAWSVQACQRLLRSGNAADVLIPCLPVPGKLWLCWLLLRCVWSAMCLLPRLAAPVTAQCLVKLAVKVLTSMYVMCSRARRRFGGACSVSHRSRPIPPNWVRGWWCCVGVYCFEQTVSNLPRFNQEGASVSSNMGDFEWVSCDETTCEYWDGTMSNHSAANPANYVEGAGFYPALCFVMAPLSFLCMSCCCLWRMCGCCGGWTPTHRLKDDGNKRCCPCGFHRELNPLLAPEDKYKYSTVSVLSARVCQIVFALLILCVSSARVPQAGRCACVLGWRSHRRCSCQHLHHHWSANG